MEIYRILSYGIIGLGFLFALLAYRLLTNEQKQKTPRTKIVRATYTFMLFSIVLCLLGILSEFLKKPSVNLTFEKPSNLKSEEINAFLGKWSGTGYDTRNETEIDSLSEAYNYRLSIEFEIINDQIIMNGTYQPTPLNSNTPAVSERTIFGTCIKNGEFLRVQYEVKTTQYPNAMGFGVMLLKFYPSSTKARGYYTSRSIQDGDMVTGQLFFNR